MQVRSGRVRSSQIESGPIRYGQVQSRPVRAGQIQSNSVWSSQDWLVCDRSGQVRAGDNFEEAILLQIPLSHGVPVTLVIKDC